MSITVMRIFKKIISFFNREKIKRRKEFDILYWDYVRLENKIGDYMHEKGKSSTTRVLQLSINMRRTGRDGGPIPEDESFGIKEYIQLTKDIKLEFRNDIPEFLQEYREEQLKTLT